MNTSISKVFSTIIIYLLLDYTGVCYAQRRLEGTYFSAEPSTKLALVLWETGEQGIGSLYTGEKNKFFLQFKVTRSTFTGTVNLNNNKLGSIEGLIKNDTLTLHIPDFSNADLSSQHRLILVKDTKRTNFDPALYFNPSQNKGLTNELVGTWKLIRVSDEKNRNLPLDHDGVKLMKDGQFTLLGGKASAEAMNKLNLKWYIEGDIFYVKSESRPDLLPELRFGKYSVSSDSLIITDDRRKVSSYSRK
jgi:hypothetical protein